MQKDYQKLLDEAKKNRKSIRKKTERLKRLRKGIIDAKIHPLHEQAFERIDCLDCANCCKTTGPLFTQADIGRISSPCPAPSLVKKTIARSMKSGLKLAASIRTPTGPTRPGF